MEDPAAASAPVDVRRRIDPDIRRGLDRLLAIVGPDGLSGLGIHRRRTVQAEVKAMRPHAPLPPQVQIRDHLVPATGDAEAAVRVRSYAPAATTGPAPCVLYLHGGGFVVGSIDGDDARAAQLAVDTGCIVISVDYRLAPEHPFPAALDDCYRALCWVVDSHGHLGIDPDRIALYGPSAGGALCAASALAARDEAGPPITYVMLVSPMLDDRCSEPSTHTNTGFGAWSREANIEAWSVYLGKAASSDSVSPLAAPARAGSLAGLPPTYLDVGDLDLFRDEVVTYAGRLMRANVPVELHVYPGGVHGGEHFAPSADLSVRVRNWRHTALRRALRVEQDTDT
jgi:acetyl esterase/lipase